MNDPLNTSSAAADNCRRSTRSASAARSNRPGFAALACGARALAFLALALSASAAQVTLNPVGYENRIYTTPPPNLPGTSSNPQAKALSAFGGNLGVAGATSTPKSGNLYLVQSSFGQPVEAPSNPDFLFGQEIIPNLALGADLSREPIIDPVGRAIYITDARRVFAAADRGRRLFRVLRR